MRIEDAKPGVRVKYTKDKIDDVPKGRGGEIVGVDENPRFSAPIIMVLFDGVSALRYMSKSDLALEPSND